MELQGVRLGVVVTGVVVRVMNLISNSFNFQSIFLFKIPLQREVDRLDGGDDGGDCGIHQTQAAAPSRPERQVTP